METIFIIFLVLILWVAIGMCSGVLADFIAKETTSLGAITLYGLGGVFTMLLALAIFSIQLLNNVKWEKIILDFRFRK